MKYKIIKIFFLLFFFLTLLIFKLSRISVNENLNNSALKQTYYNVEISKIRGMIYDCNNLPLVGTKKKLFALVNPRAENFLNILNCAKKDKNIYDKIKQEKPFIIEIDKKSDYSNIDIFELPVRSKKEISSLHMVGYVNGENNGVCGIEKAYNDFLKSDNKIEVKYKVNANGKIILNDKYRVIDKLYISNKGIKTSIDKEQQCVVEKIARKHIKKGAVIVSEVPNCEIRACVSLPTFFTKKMCESLEDAESPFLNRALSSYNVGSIFKLLVAGVYLESGFDKDFPYNCKGYYELSCGRKIHCFSGKPHGNLDLKNAIAFSCNSYFSRISKELKPEILLDYAKKLGLGQKTKLGPDFYGNNGNLPSLKQLEDEKNLAIFCFGQGQLLATPIQIAAFINAIASGGYYSPPRIVLGIIDENMKYNPEIFEKSIKCFEKETINSLKDYMLASMEYGTSAKGQPENYDAAAKTSTAQTGIFKDGKRISQFWYAGFYPFKKPKYCITIISEGEGENSSPCPKVFKEIVENLRI
ncbi:MAG: penicillin-binding protein 2 [Candidatus Improbicoccus pseudotrichonymphae]|uniref:beta-lactamase n=1 Tax=Candidatus Improbicoccus pseudotrichonymphae TaxID=3033792 RepID=A0AA48HYS7_9FIRM|nr:MAG: penicillin-binding protein 2 [Candidatus Improbicoccus pseudotrichonymphae]